MKLRIPFVLASGSPRRRRLLSRIGMTFAVDTSDADETPPAGLTPAQVAEELARRKAEVVAARHPEALTLGADTIVVMNGMILDKPASVEDARRTLRRLAGRTHVVYTGIALVHPPSARAISAHEATRVTFADMDDEEIEAYVASGSPMDKAGAYGIQDDQGALFVRCIEGDYYNVVGLPLHRFYQTLKGQFADLLAQDYLIS